LGRKNNFNVVQTHWYTTWISLLCRDCCNHSISCRSRLVGPTFGPKKLLAGPRPAVHRDVAQSPLLMPLPEMLSGWFLSLLQHFWRAQAVAPAGPQARAGGARARVCAACLNVTCVSFENGKFISPIDSAQPTMAHDADTDSDLLRPPDGKHPSARNATPAMLLRSATRQRTAGHVVAHPGPGDSE
jgi:hypothetical protein